MKRWRIAFALVFFFFALNLIFPGVYAQEKGKERRPMRKGFPSLFEMLIDLTPEQKADLQKFRKMKREERDEFLDKMKAKHRQLRQLIKNPEAKQEKIDNLIDEISTLRSTHLKKILQQKREIKKIFTPEQLKKMKKLREKLLKRRLFQRRRYFRRRHFLQRHRFPFWRRGGNFRGRFF